MQYFRTLIYIYIQGRYFLSPAQRKADYRSHKSMCKMHNKKCVPLNPKQLDQNNCYLHLSTVTLLSLFQVAISTFPSTIHPFGVWHVGQTHPSTRLQVLLQLLSVALVEHLGKWVPEYGQGRKNMRTGLGNGSENQKRSTGKSWQRIQASPWNSWSGAKADCDFLCLHHTWRQGETALQDGLIT